MSFISCGDLHSQGHPQPSGHSCYSSWQQWVEIQSTWSRHHPARRPPGSKWTGFSLQPPNTNNQAVASYLPRPTPLSSSICTEKNTGCIRSQASGVNFQHYEKRIKLKWNPTGKSPSTILKIYPFVSLLKPAASSTTAQSWLHINSIEQLPNRAKKTSDVLNENFHSL